MTSIRRRVFILGSLERGENSDNDDIIYNTVGLKLFNLLIFKSGDMCCMKVLELITIIHEINIQDELYNVACSA